MIIMTIIMTIILTIIINDDYNESKKDNGDKDNYACRDDYNGEYINNEKNDYDNDDD